MTTGANEPPESPGGGLPPEQSTFGPEIGRPESGLPFDPTIGGAYSHAWEILKADFWSLLLIGFVAWLLDSVVVAALSRDGERGLVATLYQYLIGWPIAYGAAYAWLRAVRGLKPEVSDLFVPFQRNWISCVLASILLSVILAIGLILCVIPGIFLAVRLAFVPFLVVDEGRGPVQALQESWNRTSGYGWTIFGAGLLGILVIIVGLILLIVGSIPATMLVYLAFASLYAAITTRKGISAPVS